MSIARGRRGHNRNKAFLDLDLNGHLIDSRPKESKSTEIEGDGRFCGHRFALKGKLYGDKRCIYCGDWFHWNQMHIQKWIMSGNIDPHNVDNVIEPLHCGSDHCSEYHHLCDEAMIKKAKMEEEMIEHRSMELFKELKQRKVL